MERGSGGRGAGGRGADRLPFAAIVYNPTKVDLRRLRPLVEKVEAERGWAPSLWAETTVADPGEAASAQLLAHVPTPSVLIAVGGDGTVSAVAQALVSRTSQSSQRLQGAGASVSRDGAVEHPAPALPAGEQVTAPDTRELSVGVPLGILPAGTTNLFARALGLPLRSHKKALLAAFSDTVRTVDVGRVDARLESGATLSRAFMVMAGMGVDAQMVVNTSARGKSALGWTGYIAAIVGSFVTNRRFDLSYTLDGDALAAAPAHTIVVGNAGVLPAGIRMIPGARIDDGLLDVVVLRPSGFAQWTHALGWFVRTNTPALPRRAAGRAAADGSAPVVSAAVTHSRATTVSWSAGPAQDFEIDGEHLGRVTSADAHIEPAALRVRGSVAP
ncbi:diacylglycerol/lipid kinase family protein [Subtercola endophyticus]|uniref:diacylglycerol/lipid kinase family protein n=1 Tax=Subtercola endophyticus TaxID=2895559 RepID=UPI001E36AFEA|nr:diacylglycerol kinase family protein [Subtercola endophyticus]UFS58063.1 hypothetical protein LQ955_13705 [Subtercola endophyticus]